MTRSDATQHRVPYVRAICSRTQPSRSSYAFRDSRSPGPSAYPGTLATVSFTAISACGSGSRTYHGRIRPAIGREAGLHSGRVRTPPATVRGSPDAPQRPPRERRPRGRPAADPRAPVGDAREPSRRAARRLALPDPARRGPPRPGRRHARGAPRRAQPRVRRVRDAPDRPGAPRVHLAELVRAGRVAGADLELHDGALL